MVAVTVARMLPERDQIVADVRAHIEERLQRGDDLDVIIARLGDPDTLAESDIPHRCAHDGDVPRHSPPIRSPEMRRENAWDAAERHS